MNRFSYNLVLFIYLLTQTIPLISVFLSLHSFYPEGSSLNSREELAKYLINASVFLVLISKNYANDPVCCDIFKYAATTLKKNVFFVTVGDDFSWQQSTTLGVFLTDVVSRAGYHSMCIPHRCSKYCRVPLQVYS